MKQFLITLALALVGALHGWAAPVSHHVSPASMNANTRAKFESMLDGDAKHWDADAKLLRAARGGLASMPVPANGLENWHYWSGCCFNVRGTGDYALALLMRDGPGDRERAAQGLESVLKNQYHTPGVRWYGTFKRTPEEPDPGPNAAMWRDYDPNWREFIGTTFEIILIEYPDRLPPDLVKRLYASIDLAIEGEIAEQRLVPAYTNPTLMYGALWDFAAEHDQRNDWKMESGDWIEGVYNLYRLHDTFSEFNSPSYDETDLFGLALWRDYGSTERIRTIGSEIQAALWRQIAMFYQPDLGNLCGPYDRAYGMDMRGYASGVGSLMATQMEVKDMPIPSDNSGNRESIGAISPEMALLGTQIPPDVLPKLKTFSGERLLRVPITDERVATMWIGKNVMFGAEFTGKTKNVSAGTGKGLYYEQPSQFHPVTVHWRTPSGEIGWIMVAESPMIDAVADKNGITISTTGTLRIRMHANDLMPAQISQTLWDLPGLHVAVKADAQSHFTLEKTQSANIDPVARGEADSYDIVYQGITNMRLDIKADADK